jgi:two-component system cell cycle response regulator
MARILFVDDDQMTLDTYKTIMGYFGHESLLAIAGKLAIEMAINEQPDIIIIDMNMPDMHGFDVLRRLKKLPETSHIPAVMVSASPDAVADGAYAAGAQAYRGKPVRPDDLLELIDTYTTKDA